MKIEQYTEKHLDLICKKIQTEFYIFQTSDSKIHFAFDIFRIGKRIDDVEFFVSGIDFEHVKKYLIEMLHAGHCKVCIATVGYPFNIDKYTEDRVCCYALHDMKSIVKRSEYIHYIADNEGWHGFKTEN